MAILRRNPSRVALMAIVALTVGVGGAYFAMPMHHSDTVAHRHGAHGGGHDEINMPGLRGENASPAESEEIAVLFRGFDTITREVTNLPNGIRTLTASTDQTVMDALVNHSVGMIDRVSQLNDPKIIIQSPTLDIFFLRGDGISSNVEMTDAGLLVVQTSDDPELVAALQTHAAEVTAMADKGMQAVHEMMIARAESQ
ncbi:MAG: hypothetical protein R8G34_13225 [Paracoccaceae bacterium]|nr:hypothetical protein [Paracoccaceae bacterium]